MVADEGLAMLVTYENIRSKPSPMIEDSL